MILGDNGDIYRLVGSNGQFLTYNYDNYPGETQHIIPTAVKLIDYSPYGDYSYTTCDPSNPSNCWVVTTTHPTNIGSGDLLHGEAGNDVIYGETGADTIFGDGQDDTLYGNSGGDWISGGTGDDGVLGDDGLLEVARNGIAEPLFGLAATTQLTLSNGDANSDDIVVTVNVTGALNYTAIEQPFYAGGNDIIYGGLGNDFLHGGGGDDAMSGAEALPLYYDNGHNPFGVLASLSAYYTPGNVLGFNPSTGLFRYFNPNDPFEKIYVAPGIDFLLNFVSATSFDATTPQTVVDDGQDVLFGDGGNDWLVGGTNQDVLFGGAGNDLLNADDNLDSTKVTIPVTYSSLCSLVGQFSSSSHETSDLCNQLNNIQYSDAHYRSYDPTYDLNEWAEQVTDDINCYFTADEAATLIRLVQALMPGYDPNANNTVDPRGTGPTNADIAFGGIGHDILIANTAGDRLLDDGEDANAYLYPWEGGPGPTVDDNLSTDDLQLLLDLGLALGADPTRPDVVVPCYPYDPTYLNGEPFGELGLVRWQDDDFPWDYDHNHSYYWPVWWDETNPGLDLEGHPDYGSLGLVTLLTPSAHPQQIDDIWHVDDNAEGLLNRIVVRGQLTAAEYATLSWDDLRGAERPDLERPRGQGRLRLDADEPDLARPRTRRSAQHHQSEHHVEADPDHADRRLRHRRRGRHDHRLRQRLDRGRHGHRRRRRHLVGDDLPAGRLLAGHHGDADGQPAPGGRADERPELRRRRHRLPEPAGDHVHLDPGPDHELDARHRQRHRRRRRLDHAVRRLPLDRLRDHRRQRHLVAVGQPERRQAHADGDADDPGRQLEPAAEADQRLERLRDGDGLRAAAGAVRLGPGRLARPADHHGQRRRRRHGHGLRGLGRRRNRARRRRTAPGR